MRASLLALHLIGVVLWMGGLLAFSRILGYHAREAPSARPRLTYIEGRLNWLVAVPGAVITLAFGWWLVSNYGGLAWIGVTLWMKWKLALAAAVMVLHVVLTVRHRKILRAPPDAPMKRGLYAALHGTVGLLLIALLFLATHKPL